MKVKAETDGPWRGLWTGLVAAAMLCGSLPAAAETLRVMSFNLWVGGVHSGLEREACIDAQIAAIRQAKADVVALQEQTETSGSRARALAEKLGWHCHVVSSSRAVVSRLPMQPAPKRAPQPAGHHRSAGDVPQAVHVTLPSGRKAAVGVVHLAPAPYEPYHIVDGTLKSAEEAERSARRTRLAELESLFEQIRPEADLGMPVIIAGDFNEPSRLDWTTAAVALRRNPEVPFAVDWPCSRFLAEKGFADAYREIHPDPVARPGNTWTPHKGTERTVDVMDRIDLIFVTRDKVKVSNAWVVGEAGPESDIRVEPWTSDHRAVAAELEL